MTRFIHKNNQIEISYSEYCKLTELEKNDFVIVNSNDNISNTTNTTNITNDNNDMLGLGKVVEKTAETAFVVATLPFVIIKKLF